MAQISTHYDNLKVTRNAPLEVIRAAYRSLSQKHHPDRNSGNPEAVRIMAILNASYEVLSDPDKRRKHDLWIAQQEQIEAQPAKPKPPPSPPPASQQTTSPPRTSTSSGDVLTHVLRNKFWYGVVGLFVFIWATDKPNTPSPGPKPYLANPQSDESPKPRNTIANLPNDVGGDRQGKQGAKASGWRESMGGQSRKDFDAAYFGKPAKKSEPFDRESFDAAYFGAKASGWRESMGGAKEGVEDFDTLMTRLKAEEEKSGMRFRAAPNGRSWPVNAGYVGGYPRLHDTGLSKVTIDNSRNDSAVFVKLVLLESAQAYPVRQIYIPAHGRFTLNTVSEGRYDIRYRDLGNGGLSRSEAFDLEELPTGTGTQFSSITMTLYKIKNGNMKTYPLAEGEF